MQNILSGIRVVDLTAYAAGPYATMLLSDLGADVIKVEPPGTGDNSRNWGKESYNGRSFLFIAVNPNKRSLVVDLKSAEGRSIVEDLVRKADIVVESFNLGVAERLGIGYEQLARIKPDLIYCSISGFGRTGPLKDWPGFDMMLQAYTGLMSITGEPGRSPVRIGPGAIDLMTGSLAFGGIVSALYHRQRTGEGQRLEASLYDTSISLLNYSAVEYAATGYVQEPTGGQHPHIAPYEVFAGSDRWFFLGAASDRHFERLCDHFGFAEIKADPAFATNAQRVRDRGRLKSLLEPHFRSMPAQHWVDGCTTIGIPATLIRRVDEATDDEHAVARGAIVPVPGMAPFRMPGVPIHFAKTPGAVKGEPPTAGRDTTAVLKELGYDDARITALRDKGVVVQGADPAVTGMVKDR